MAESVEDYIARAIADPGSILERDYPEEPTERWSARAVGQLLSVMYGPDSEGFYAGTPATRALMDNAQLRAQLETTHQDALMWKRRAQEAEGKPRHAVVNAERIGLLEHLLALAVRQGVPSWLLDRIYEAVPDLDKVEV